MISTKLQQSATQIPSANHSYLHSTSGTDAAQRRLSSGLPPRQMFASTRRLEDLQVQRTYGIFVAQAVSAKAVAAPKHTQQVMASSSVILLDLLDASEPWLVSCAPTVVMERALVVEGRCIGAAILKVFQDIF